MKGLLEGSTYVLLNVGCCAQMTQLCLCACAHFIVDEALLVVIFFFDPQDFGRLIILQLIYWCNASSFASRHHHDGVLCLVFSPL